MPFFKKKPVVIEAWQAGHLISFASNHWKLLPECIRQSYEKGEIIFTPEGMHIKTLEGWMQSTRDCFIIKGVKGELYPCRRDIFFETYEVIPEKLPEDN